MDESVLNSDLVVFCSLIIVPQYFEGMGPNFACVFSRIHGSHRLEKYFNLEGFLEKSLKIKSVLKST